MIFHFALPCALDQKWFLENNAITFIFNVLYTINGNTDVGKKPIIFGSNLMIISLQFGRKSVHQ